MSVQPEFRKITFDQRLDVKRLLTAVARTTRESMKNPVPNAGPVRVERIFIAKDETTVFVSGNRAGLGALAAALGKSFSRAKVSEASQDDVARQPPASEVPGRGVPNPRRRA